MLQIMFRMHSGVLAKDGPCGGQEGWGGVGI